MAFGVPPKPQPQSNPERNTSQNPVQGPHSAPLEPPRCLVMESKKLSQPRGTPGPHLCSVGSRMGSRMEKGQEEKPKLSSLCVDISRTGALVHGCFWEHSSASFPASAHLMPAAEDFVGRTEGRARSLDCRKTGQCSKCTVGASANSLHML